MVTCYHELPRNLDVCRLEFSLSLSKAQWDRLEKLDYAAVQKVVPGVHSLEWSGHFGRAVYFKVDVDGNFGDAVREAEEAREKILSLLNRRGKAKQ